MQQNLGGHELTIQDSGAPRGERNHWEVTLNGVVLYSDYSGKKANQLHDALESALTDMAPKIAQLPIQGGEAVEVVATVRAKGFGRVFEAASADAAYLHCSEGDQLMTVAQHQRILAAATSPGEQAAEPDIAQEMQWLERWIQFAAEPIGQECCNRPGSECCGCPDICYRNSDDIISAMHARREELRALLAKP